MRVQVTNAQRDAAVNTARMARLARCAIRRLRIRTPGTLAITFIGSHRMRALNKRFLRHDWPTDVLSFRYDGAGTRRGHAARHGELMVGEILVSPRQAQAYAKRAGIPYAEELCRYVVHGLLHWRGHEDRTPAERRRMRAREDWLLAWCGGNSRDASILPIGRRREK